MKTFVGIVFVLCVIALVLWRSGAWSDRKPCDGEGA